MRNLSEQLISRNAIYIGKESVPLVLMSENHDAREAIVAIDERHGDV